MRTHIGKQKCNNTGNKHIAIIVMSIFDSLTERTNDDTSVMIEGLGECVLSGIIPKSVDPVAKRCADQAELYIFRKASSDLDVGGCDKVYARVLPKFMYWNQVSINAGVVWPCQCVSVKMQQGKSTVLYRLKQGAGLCVDTQVRGKSLTQVNFSHHIRMSLDLAVRGPTSLLLSRYDFSRREPPQPRRFRITISRALTPRLGTFIARRASGITYYSAAETLPAVALSIFVRLQPCWRL